MSKYTLDLDYVTPLIDISREELNEIIAEADAIISENKMGNKELAEAYLKKAQCLQKLEEYREFEDIDTTDDYQNINTDTQNQIKNLLEKALEIIPNMPEALMQMGKYYFKMSMSGNDYIDKAIEMYTTAIKIKPNYDAAYNNRGILYASEVYSRIKNSKPNDNLLKAISDFTKAIQIWHKAIYYFNRGRNYSKLKEHEKSIDDFSRALYYCSDEFKKKMPLYYLRGQEYTEIKDYESAISNYSESIRLRPDLFRAFLMRGNAYLGIGDKEKAKADFDEYLRRKNKIKAAEKQFAFFLECPQARNLPNEDGERLFTFGIIDDLDS